MNDIINLSEYTRGEVEPCAKTHPGYNPFPQDSTLYFTAYTDDIETRRGCPIATHKAIYKYEHEQQTGQLIDVPLAVVGKGYNVVQNEELFKAAERQMLHTLSHAELTGMIVEDKMSYGGRLCSKEYRFPAIRVQINETSELDFRICIVNGFGGSSLRLLIGAWELLCSNGMVIGEYQGMYHRHTKGLRISDIAAQVENGIKAFYRNARTWRVWAKRAVRDEDVKDYFDSLPNLSQSRAERLFLHYLGESDRRGKTLWAVYATLTYFATHNEGDFAVRDTGSDHEYATLLKREVDVLNWVQGDEFKKLWDQSEDLTSP